MRATKLIAIPAAAMLAAWGVLGACNGSTSSGGGGAGGNTSNGQGAADGGTVTVGQTVGTGPATVGGW